MENQNRRQFLKSATALSIGIAGLGTQTAKASQTGELSEDRKGVLVDTTVVTFDESV